MNLKGKTAVITGAGGGIGSALVKELKKEGVKLILLEKDLNLLEHLGDILDGPEHRRYECDLSKSESVVEVAEKIVKEVGQIDLLYNVAGVGIYKNIKELGVDEWKKSFEINVDAPFILIKKFLPLLEKSQDSLVFNVGSRMAAMVIAGSVAYRSTKFALRGMSLTLSKEYKGKNPSFCLLTLGSVMTPFGTGGIEKRKRLESGGKKYFSPHEVAEKMIEVTKDDKRKDEVLFYPEDHGKKR